MFVEMVLKTEFYEVKCARYVMENMLLELEHTQNFCDNSQFKHIINNNQNKNQHWETSRTHALR